MREIIRTWEEIKPSTSEEWVKFIKTAGQAIILFGILGAMLWLGCALS